MVSMPIHTIKPYEDRNKIDYLLRYSIILFLEDIIYIIDIPIITNTLNGLNELWDTIIHLRDKNNEEDEEYEEE